MDFKLIIFDLDGTLLDTATEITDAANCALESLHLNPISSKQTRDWVGNGAANFYEQAVCWACQQEGAQRPPESEYAAGYAIFLREYGERSGRSSVLYPHVRQALEKLRGQGITLCVLTNKMQAFAQQALDLHGIGHLFGEVLGGDTFAEKKPEPKGVHYCMARYGVEPALTLFVGDSYTDVETARNAGVAVWALPYGYNHGLPIEQARPDKIIADFSVFL